MTMDDWTRFRTGAAREIRDFASATPSARRRRRWKAPLPELHLAAYQCCLEARALLTAVDLIRPGGSYRDMVYAAPVAAQDVWEAVDLIPFQGFRGEVCPFRDLRA